MARCDDRYDTLRRVEEQFLTAAGTFTLRRSAHETDPSLRAWDAADEYLLDHLHAEAITGDGWLVVNDGFGALTVALTAAGRRVVSWSDSAVDHTAAIDNLTRNGLDLRSVEFLSSVDDVIGPIDVAVVKIPRTVAFLEHQLHHLRPTLADDACVIGAAMTRNVHQSTIDTFERILGPTPTTHARKKARLLVPNVDLDLDPGLLPGPATWTAPAGFIVNAFPNVFSATAIDAGTALLLDHLPTIAPGARVVDLGCGTGVVGATVATRSPDATVVCVDESYQAVASARATMAAVSARAEFHVIDVLDGIAHASADVVIVNPPFHVGGARTSSVARRMIAEAARVLRPGGVLRLVANRHLGHHLVVERVFGAVEVVGSDPRFVVLGATKAAAR